jgi:cob(I)alamin adenosyltransferase
VKLKSQDAKAHLNELESEVGKVNKAIEQLKTNESFELIQEDLVKARSEVSRFENETTSN